MGGALAAIESGYIQNEIQEAAYRYQKAVENKEQIVVGVNAFQVEEKLELEALQVDPAIEQQQRRRLSELRASRDPVRVSELLGQLEQAAKGSEKFDAFVHHDGGKRCNAWGNLRRVTKSMGRIRTSRLDLVQGVKKWRK